MISFSLEEDKDYLIFQMTTASCFRHHMRIWTHEFRITRQLPENRLSTSMNDRRGNRPEMSVQHLTCSLFSPLDESSVIMISRSSFSNISLFIAGDLGISRTLNGGPKPRKMHAILKRGRTICKTHCWVFEHEPGRFEYIQLPPAMLVENLW